MISIGFYNFSSRYYGAPSMSIVISFEKSFFFGLISG